MAKRESDGGGGMKLNVYQYAGVLIASFMGLLVTGCAAPGPEPIGPRSVELLGVAAINPLHPMTGEPIGGFSGLTYDPVAQAWLVVSHRQPEAVAYTLRTSFDPRPESDGRAWVAGPFDAWLGREWAVPGEAQDAEAVAVRRTTSGNHQRFWAFEREPTLIVEDVRSGSVRSLPIPEEVSQHYRFDGAFKGLAVVPERIGDRLWVALGAPLTIDEERSSGMLRILSYPADGDEAPTASFFPRTDTGDEIAAMATVPDSGWRDDLPVFVLVTSTDENSRRLLRLVAIQGSEVAADRSLPVLVTTEVAALTDLLGSADGATAWGDSLGLAIGPQIADRRGGRIVLVATTVGPRQSDPRHLIYALRIAID